MKRLIVLPLAFLALGATPAVAQLCARPEMLHAPQPELAKEPLVFVTRDGTQYRFMVEMALSPAQQEVGLMSRPSVAADGGMLFDWVTLQQSRMWMCNTIAPLDMVFIRQNGTIDAIAEDTVPQSLAEVDSRGPVRATLELAAGTTARLGIRVGDTVKQRIFGNAG